MGQEAEERTVQEAEGQQAVQTEGQPAPDTAPAQAEGKPSARKPMRISSPEQVDDYIRVTTPGMWLLVLALVILLCAGMIWAYAARIEITTKDQNGQEMTEYIAPAAFLTDGNIGN